MLNAAIKNVGNGESITPEDSIETIKARFILTEFGDDNSYEHAVVVKDIIDKGDDYELELCLGEDDLEGIQNWAGWADLTEVYGVTIYADFYDYGTYPGFLVLLSMNWRR